MLLRIRGLIYTLAGDGRSIRIRLGNAEGGAYIDNLLFGCLGSTTFCSELIIDPDSGDTDAYLLTLFCKWPGSLYFTIFSRFSMS
jgi:hypothetical protein